MLTFEYIANYFKVIFIITNKNSCLFCYSEYLNISLNYDLLIYGYISSYCYQNIIIIFKYLKFGL